MIYMFRTVRDACIKHKQALAEQPEFQANFEEFDQHLMQIEGWLLNIERINEMATIDQLELGEQMVEKAIVISSAACVWAIHAEKRDTQARLDALRSELFKTHDLSIIDSCRQILTETQALLKPLAAYGINKLELRHLALLIEAYAASKQSPASHDVTLGDLVSKTAQFLSGSFDYTVEDLADEFPEFFQDYVQARRSFDVESDRHVAA